MTLPLQVGVAETTINPHLGMQIDGNIGAYRPAQFVLSEPLHSDQQPALLPGRARPFLDIGIQMLPTAKVEIADTEIGTVGDGQRLLQRRQ